VEYIDFMAKVSADPDFSLEFHMLAVLDQGLHLSNLTVDVMRQMRAADAVYRNRPPGTLAVILVEDKMAKIIGKLYAELATNDPDFDTEIHVVSNAAEASAVLGVSLADLPMPNFAQ